MCWACWVIIAWPSVVQFVASLRLHEKPLPSFYISQYSGNCDPEGSWKDLISDAENHPSRSYNENAADFSLLCIPWNETNFLALPKKTYPKFYLFWGLRIAWSYPKWSPAMRARKDFIFASFDLREQLNDTAVPLPGVTIPAQSHHSSQLYDPETPPKYFMTFRGGLHGSVRKKIVNAFKKYKKKGVVVETGGPNGKGIKRYLELLNSSYVLVPAGHGRWSYRLAEVVESCAIPVIMADGLTLPYEELIDWNSIAIVLKEDVMDEASRSLTKTGEGHENQFNNILLNPKKMLSLLPHDPNMIKAKRKRVCEISTQYFNSKRKQFESMLKSAARYVRIHAGSLQHEVVTEKKMIERKT